MRLDCQTSESESESESDNFNISIWEITKASQSSLDLKVTLQGSLFKLLEIIKTNLKGYWFPKTLNADVAWA